MKIEQSELAGRLAKVKTAIPGKNSPSGIQGVLIKGDKAIATNYEIGITATLTVEADEPFILSLKAIEMIESLPDGIVEIKSGADHKITIITNGIKSTFSGLDPKDFNEPAALDSIGQSLKIDSKKLHEIVSSVLYAASTNESRPVFTGALFEAIDGEMNIVAVDGYRAAWNRTAFDGEFKFIVPKTTLDKLLKLGIDGEIEISLGKNSAVFASEDYTVYTRLLSGEFLNYKAVLPKHSQQIVVNRKGLLESINRILICVDDKVKTPAVMSFEGEKMILSLKSNTTSYSEEIEVHGAIDEDLRIGFNSHYLRDAAKSYNAEFVTMAFGTAVQPMVMSDDELLSLILPVRLKNQS